MVGAVRPLRAAFDALSHAAPADAPRLSRLEAEIREGREFDRKLRDPPPRAAHALPSA